MIYLSKRVCSFYWLFLIVSLVACVTSSFKTKTQLVAPVEVNRSNNDFRAISNKGMVVAAHHLSAEAGAEILERGGNAADAAVASSFVISVVRPHSTGLGGGGFLLYFDHAERKTKVYDFRERAPKAATRDLYYDAKGQPKKAFFGSQPVPTPSMNGHRAVAVPGLVRGLIEFHRLHGRLKLAEVMAPAIRAATLGFPIYPTLAAALDERKEILKLYASSKKIFFRDGRPLRQGEVLIQSDLAATLTEISEQGDAVFYQGSIAEKIVAEMKRGNGLVTASDLSGYAMLERQPLSGTYHGRTITSMPPPSSGGVHLIQMLNILESDDLPSIGRATSAYDHLLVEAMRRAFADRAIYMGDPGFVEIPIKQLISKSYAKKLRQSIRLDHATVSTELHNPAVSPGESSSTTHISVVDSSGNAVSTTQTINYSFGSCVVAEGTGIVLNDEMDDFAANPGVPNAFGLVQGEANSISPGKTPLSSMTPTIVFDEQGEVQMVLGSPGGPKIINAVLQTLINAVDFKLSLLDSVHGFRLHHQWLPDQIRYEKGGLTSEEEVGLKRRGHVLVPVGSIGEIAAILKRPEGGWEGVADARAEGKAVGQK